MVKKKPAAQAKTAENETEKVETKAAEKTTAAEKEAVKEVAKEVVKETAAAEEAPAKAEEKPAAKAAKTTRTTAKKTTTKKAAAPKKPAAVKKPAEKKSPAKAAKKEAEQEMILQFGGREIKEKDLYERIQQIWIEGYGKKAEELIQYLQTPDDKSVNVAAGMQEQSGLNCRIESIEKKKEKKNPPLLYNLAELQNDCSKRFKISPDETLRIVQELYEKKLVTYPRTDARVLSTAVAKEITRNLNGLSKYSMAAPYMQDILNFGSYKTLAKTRYVNDKQITDHYAIVPTGQGLNALRSAE